MKSVLLKVCQSNFEAQIIKGELLSEGIPCVLEGEHMSVIYGQTLPFSTRIMVNEEDLERALSIIENVNTEDTEEEEAK